MNDTKVYLTEIMSILEAECGDRYDKCTLIEHTQNTRSIELERSGYTTIKIMFTKGRTEMDWFDAMKTLDHVKSIFPTRI